MHPPPARAIELNRCASIWLSRVETGLAARPGSVGNELRRRSRGFSSYLDNATDDTASVCRPLRTRWCIVNTVDDVVLFISLSVIFRWRPRNVSGFLSETATFPRCTEGPIFTARRILWSFLDPSRSGRGWECRPMASAAFERTLAAVPNSEPIFSKPGKVALASRRLDDSNRCTALRSCANCRSAVSCAPRSMYACR